MNGVSLVLASVAKIREIPNRCKYLVEVAGGECLKWGLVACDGIFYMHFVNGWILCS